MQSRIRNVLEDKYRPRFRKTSFSHCNRVRAKFKLCRFFEVSELPFVQQRKPKFVRKMFRARLLCNKTYHNYRKACRAYERVRYIHEVTDSLKKIRYCNRYVDRINQLDEKYISSCVRCEALENRYKTKS